MTKLYLDKKTVADDRIPLLVSRKELGYLLTLVRIDKESFEKWVEENYETETTPCRQDKLEVAQRIYGYLNQANTVFNT